MDTIELASDHEIPKNFGYGNILKESFDFNPAKLSFIKDIEDACNLIQHNIISACEATCSLRISEKS